MTNLLAICVLSLAATDVEIKTIADQSVTGSLVKLSSDQVVINTDSGEQSFGTHQLLAVTPRVSPSPAVEPPPEILVELIDGSRVWAVSYEVANRRAMIGIAGGGALQVFTRSIRSVLMRRHDDLPDLSAQWSDVGATALVGDAIVIRKQTEEEISIDGKPATRTVETLKPHVGVLQDITADTVQFKFDDQLIDVRREKVEGVIYYHANPGSLVEPLCHVIDVHGSRWMAKELQLVNDALELTTTAGAEFSLPLTGVRNFDFTVGKIVYLSDLEPESVRWNAYIGSPSNSTNLAKFYEPRFDRARDGGPLSLYFDGEIKRFDKGLALRSQTAVVFRLPDDFRHFVATVGIDPSVRDAGHVQLVVSGDGKPIFEAIVTGKDAEPLQLDLDIQGVQRLRILVDFGDELDISDHLNLCNAKVTK